MVIVKTKEELKQAISRREHIFVANKDLSKKLKLLTYVKCNSKIIYTISNSTSNVIAGTALASSAGVPVVVATTLIVTIGIVCVVAILKDYKIKLDVDGYAELEPTR